ncbi:P-loop containing nucleoside triphosphate hydrolase protein [Mycena epipterygia]|nr:P-loop containing nucleoside triphosphate hydrolase protein [Mycena epipterygia]
MVNPPEWIDRRNGHRTVPMQVLGLGFSRTGTSSLQVALEMLGYVETHHGRHVFSNPFEMDMWIEAINARFFGKGKPYEREDWDRMLGHCQAVTDIPHILFSKDLIEAYPDAKVILTMRDPDSWWKSITETGIPVHRSWLLRLNAWMDPDSEGGKVRELQQLFAAAFFGKVDPGSDEAETAKAGYRAHYDKVRGLVPRERLLEFDVKEGWEPLCKFLGKDVPDTPFPRVNDALQFQQEIAQQKAAILKKILMKFVLPIIVVMACAFIRYR